GNTVAGSGSNGGEVLRRTRELNTVIGAFRPNYTLNDDEMTYEKFKEFMAKYEAEKAELPPKYDLPEFKSAVAKKITDGTRPQSLVSREEVAIMIERAIKT
ncbi:MAG: hypothetical protein LBN43_07455, partial [Oscillospiraceae bacterium]|nr:hypothetical protein [Oscillospiraceae bacterium]